MRGCPTIAWLALSSACAVAGCAGAPDADDPSTQRPDLVVAEVTWAPEGPAAGESVVFSAAVLNQGSAATADGVILGVSFWVDGTQISWSDTSTTPLAPGAARVLAANGGPHGAVWTASAGDHAIRAWVDDAARIAEADEANNERTETVHVAVGPTPQWPFDQPPLASSTRKVFAHWHWFPMSFEGATGGASDYYANAFMTIDGEDGKHAAYGGMLRERPLARPARGESDWAIRDAEYEIQLARAIGIDGFFLNMWDNSTDLWARWMAVFDAAGRQGGFGVIPNFDAVIMADLTDAELADVMVSTFAAVMAKPALYRLPDGQVPMGVFSAERRSASFYQGVIDRLKAELGLDIHFVPVFQGTGSDAIFASFAAVSGTLAGWGTAIPQSPGSAQAVADRAQAVGKPWMHPVLAQDFRPYTSDFWEAGNTLTLRSTWESVIASDQPWVQIVTWNDQAEHHALRPSTGKQWSAYDLAAYYIAWFKTGAAPPIVRDALYYSHRVHRVAMVPTVQTALASCNGNCPGRDEIELLAFLTAPGTLEIEVGGTISTLEAPSGMTSFTVALRDGTPIFRLRRGGDVPIVLTSAFPIQSSLQRQDLLYRGGGSLRAAMRATHDCEAVCQGGDVVACWTCPAEPMWLPAIPF